jgi:hypothetical protein
MGTFIALVAAIGVGTIVAALVGHLTAISNDRQAWINALRDDLAEFFKALERLNYVISDYMKDSVQNEEKKREARVALLFVYERIRLRLNRVEDMHLQLEGKLREFLDNPLQEMMGDRKKVDEAVDLARKVLKHEWEATKYPWKGYWNRRRPQPENSN